MEFKLPAFWDEVAKLIGHDLAQTVYNYLQTIQMVLIIVAIVSGGIVMIGAGLKVWFSNNEEAKKELKLSRNKIMHMIGYIFIGLIFMEVFWMWILPPIWTWAASSNPGPTSLVTIFNL